MTTYLKQDTYVHLKKGIILGIYVKFRGKIISWFFWSKLFAEKTYCLGLQVVHIEASFVNLLGWPKWPPQNV